ncbi:DUF6660 family protein [Flavobacterium terrigena]|uniref:Uncharacterized protein n=1 Tax=Flavobacterium terrigena TaxID=402734 RepID=A0A1H6XCR1_9FLAO|nr:DUF6660 family protein [Flavobacterium terrigena]SEJ26971.1 hypothetical protein SAMN05660918_2814 [Flavobacterium terrigena]
MKILNIILSVYIIMLTAYPCADKHNDVLVKSSNTSPQHNHSHDEEADLCSPFCVCNCCGQQTLTFLEIQSFQFLVHFQEIKSSISFYKSTSFSNFYGSIWQPPQLV